MDAFRYRTVRRTQIPSDIRRNAPMLAPVVGNRNGNGQGNKGGGARSNSAKRHPNRPPSQDAVNASTEAARRLLRPDGEGNRQLRSKSAKQHYQARKSGIIEQQAGPSPDNHRRLKAAMVLKLGAKLRRNKAMNGGNQNRSKTLAHSTHHPQIRMMSPPRSRARPGMRIVGFK